MKQLSPALLFVIALGCTDSSEGAFSIVDRHRETGGVGGSNLDASSGESAVETGGRSGAASGGAGGSEASTGGTDGGRTDAADGADGSAPDRGPGALVAYDFRSTEKKLYVLDPETGRPLSSESIGTVRAIVEDGADYPSDKWFVLEQTGTVDEGATVHVRRLDTGTGAFEELGALANAPAIFGVPVTFGTGGRSFLAYLSEAPAGPFSRMDLALTVVEASDPANPTLVPSSATLPGGARLALVAAGDSLGLVTAQTPPCPAGSGGAQECRVTLVHLTVTNTVGIGNSTVIDTIGPEGAIDVAVDRVREEAVIAFPPPSLPSLPSCAAASRSSGTLRTVPLGVSAPGAAIPIPVEAPRFAGTAADPCSDVAFLTTQSDDVALWAVPISAAGTPTKRCAITAGGALFYELTSRSLFRVLVTGELEAYRVELAQSGPTLTRRTLGDLPRGFRAGAMAVRSSRNPSCSGN